MTEAQPASSQPREAETSGTGNGGEYAAVRKSAPEISPDGQDAWRSGLRIPTTGHGRRFTDLTRSGNKITVTGGVIDRIARQIVTSGQCMALALAFSEANAGTPVVAFTPGSDQMAHALVRLPDGRLLDINGVHDAAVAAERYTLVDYDRQDFAA
jgi:hypothetical protein